MPSWLNELSYIFQGNRDNCGKISDYCIQSNTWLETVMFSNNTLMPFYVKLCTGKNDQPCIEIYTNVFQGVTVQIVDSLFSSLYNMPVLHSVINIFFLIFTNLHVILVYPQF